MGKGQGERGKSKSGSDDHHKVQLTKPSGLFGCEFKHLHRYSCEVNL